MSITFLCTHSSYRLDSSWKISPSYTSLPGNYPGQAWPGHTNLAKQNIVSPSYALLVWSESWHSDAQAWKELWTNIISSNYTYIGLEVISFQVTSATTYFSHTASFSSPGKIKFNLVSVSCQNMVLLSLSNYLLQWSKILGVLHWEFFSSSQHYYDIISWTFVSKYKDMQGLWNGK